MFAPLLHIGHDAIQILLDLLAFLDQLRAENPQYRFIIGPVRWMVLVVKIFVANFVNGVTDYYQVGFWRQLHFLASMIYGCAPNSVYCFNKAGFFIYFLDVYFIYLGYNTLQAQGLFLGKCEWYLYLIFKSASVVMPFLTLTPVERLPFWFICAALAYAEWRLAKWMIWCWGYGIDWKGPVSFYAKKWKKHYHYRAPTSNRVYTIDLSKYVYWSSKVLILCGAFCWDETVKEARLAAPHTPTYGALSSDYTYFSALLEVDTVANLRYGVLFLLALSSLGVYSIILAGWSSNSKYAFIGALRSAAQMISYEVAISLIILPIVIFAGSLNLMMITYIQSITVWFLWPLLPVSLLFLIAMLAETNRTPFDLPEAEAELVAGYNVDYSSLPFAMFFLGEYCNMILMAVLYCILFLGGGLNSLDLLPAAVLAIKASVIWVFFVLVRATLPRYRYDQLMDIGWKVFLPVAGSFLIFDFGLLVFFEALPVTGELPLDLTVNYSIYDEEVDPIDAAFYARFGTDITIS
jgi:formate hydrogenlyase subunit 4